MTQPSREHVYLMSLKRVERKQLMRKDAQVRAWRRKINDETRKSKDWLPTDKQTLATTAYKIPGERHDPDDDRAGHDEAMEEC